MKTPVFFTGVSEIKSRATFARDFVLIFNFYFVDLETVAEENVMFSPQRTE